MNHVTEILDDELPQKKGNGVPTKRGHRYRSQDNIRIPEDSPCSSCSDTAKPAVMALPASRTSEKATAAYSEV